MAKICVICTDKIGALTGKIKLSDGNYVCKKCFSRAGLLQVSQMFKWYNLYRQNKLKQNFLQTLRIYLLKIFRKID
ncbi:DUF4428 domain-containing protein [Enterococcus faecium]|nr:DUF4428 domain-containing protein [Enterococcus faecium]